MASFKYFIRIKNPKPNNSYSIRIRLTQGKIFDCSAQSLKEIKYENWNNNKGEVKTNAVFKGKKELVDDLKNLKLHIELAENNEPDKRKIDTDWLTKQINGFYKIEKETNVDKNLLLPQFDLYIENYKSQTNRNTGTKISIETIKKQRTCYNYLKEYEEHSKTVLRFSDMNSTFVEGFIRYLNERERSIKPKKFEDFIDRGMSINTIAKQFAVLKTFLIYTIDKRISELRKDDLKDFKFAQEESDEIYLDLSEIEKINNLDLSNNTTLDNVRDYFVIASWTGLRFSDYNLLNKKNITKDNLLNIKQTKTTQSVIIPLHKNVITILEKHNYNLPKVISNQKMNDYLKTLGKMAGLNDPFVKKITIGGETKEITLEKWQMFSTHTGRRSFATNHYKLGLDTLAIMSITGHRTERSFLKYIKVTKEEQAKRIFDFWRKLDF